MKWLSAAPLLFVLACSGEAQPPETAAAAGEGPLVVFATSYPLAWFAERIGGDAVEVVFPAPAGVDPAHWNADAETIARAQAADLLLRHGAGDPPWLDLASLHRERVVDTTAAVRERLIRRPTAVHQHGPDGEHSHGVLAGTTWLDPTLAASEAEAIASALSARRPEREESFRARLAELRRDLAELDRSLAHATEGLGDTPLLFSHPVYDYLQARYVLNGRAVAWEPYLAPNERQWRELREILVAHSATLMLWEAEPLDATRERLVSLGVESRVYAPCANRPATGDWMSVMKANRAALGVPAARPEAAARLRGLVSP